MLNEANFPLSHWLVCFYAKWVHLLCTGTIIFEAITIIAICWMPTLSQEFYVVYLFSALSASYLKINSHYL